MPTHVALLRGINIGAKKRIRMEALCSLVEGMGHSDVKTYINSGNVVFSASRGTDLTLATEIEAALKTKHDLDVPVVVRSGSEMANIVADNPFAEHASEYKTLHVSFLSDKPSPDLVSALTDVEKGEDEYCVIGKNIYLHYPNGLARAVFMINGFDKALKVISTSRNWRTVVTLSEMASEG